MSKRKRRKELADLKRAKIMASLDEKGKIDIPRSSQENCEHVWKVFCNSENSMEIEYTCEKCLIHKTEAKSYEKFESKLLPHELKNHGPAQHHNNPRRYTAPSKSQMLIGDIVEKTMIFQRCLLTGVIKKNVIGMENKIKEVDKIIPKIILDECVANSTLIKKIQELGYNIWYLGRKLSDDEILLVVEKQNAVLVTEDKEFHNRVLDNKPIRDPIFVGRNTNQIIENVEVIQKHMKQFEE